MAALDFGKIMRDHVKEEEGVLFMMADSFLQPGEQAELAASFERLEVAKSVSGRHRRIHTMPENLLPERRTAPTDWITWRPAEALEGFR